MGSTLGISVPGGTRLTTASVLHGLIVCACTLLVACWVSVLESVYQAVSTVGVALVCMPHAQSLIPAESSPGHHGLQTTAAGVTQGMSAHG